MDKEEIMIKEKLLENFKRMVKDHEAHLGWDNLLEEAQEQVKGLITGKVSDEFVEKWEKIHTSPGDKYISSKEFIKALLEDYHKDLMGEKTEG